MHCVDADGYLTIDHKYGELRRDGRDLLRRLLMSQSLRFCIENGNRAALLPEKRGDQAGPDRRFNGGKVTA